MGDRRYYAYIVASRTRILYIGVTGTIEVRMQQHRNKSFEGFTADYNCNRLVWYESYDNPGRAIAREKQLKRWIRAKKLALIEKTNPTWIDLSEGWGQPIQPAPKPAEKSRKPEPPPKSKKQMSS
ncbi:MAG: GIY-YIG nuclease family protein [Acidobacteriaceae bacterium]